MKINDLSGYGRTAVFHTQLLRIVKLTILIIMIFLIQVSAATKAQITLNESGISLQKALKSIRKQSGYDFIYSDQDLKQANPVTLKLSKASLETALQICFAGQPLIYAIEDKTVMIKKKEDQSFLDRVIAALNAIDVHGRVLDEKGIPMPGVIIRVKNGNQATVSDQYGDFSLRQVDAKAVLIFSSIGHVTKEVNASSNMSRISLEISNSKLDEVQVIAYGETSQRLNTGNVTTIGAKEIGQQPVSNPLLALEGRVPGLVITQSTGVPGSGVSVQIRGQNSIQSGNDPLYVIDGVPYISQMLPSGGYVLGYSGTITGAQGNPLNYIDPADIENISVLKDAGATAIYGSRGANGVILITTKKGRPGDTRVDVNVQSGFGHEPHKLDLLNTEQYLQMRNEALKNDGITPSLANGDYDLKQWDTQSYTNWQKVLIGNTSHYTDAQASVSGGNFNNQFLIGGGYHRETNVFPGDFADQKGSMHFSLKNTSANKKFNVTLTGSYMIDNNQLPNNDLTYSAIALAPDAPPLYNSNGAINWAPNSTGTSTFYNPIAQNSSTYQNKTNNLIANMTLSYTIMPGLTIKSSFGYTNMQTNDMTLYPLTIYAPEVRSTVKRSAGYFNNNVNSWIIEPQISYQKLVAKSKFEVLIGSTIEQNNYKGQNLSGSGYNSDQVMADLQSAANVYSVSSIASTYKYNALFGRLNYNWNDEYLADLTARRDGSSRFGANNEFHNFGAAGIGWIFTKEPLVQHYVPVLSYGKLRASYGTTGNDQIGDYQYLSLYSPVSTGVPYQGTTGLAPTGLPNPDLQWELTRKLEFGLEAGLFKDRILVTASYSRNRSSNQLLGYTLSIITGFNTISSNFPATVQNTNWEFALNTTNIKNKSFRWTSNLNLTIPKNALIAFPSLSTSSYANSLIIGQPLNIKKAYHYTGVDPATGRYMFTSTTNIFRPRTIDRTALVNTLPRFYGGFQNSVSYKSLSIDFLFQFVKRTGANNLFAYGVAGTANNNQFTSVLSRWKAPGDITNVERFSSNSSLSSLVNAAASSDAAYSDASFIKLKNVSLSWQLQQSWLKAVHIQNARLYVQGQNLLTITHYKGLDPETTSSTSLPPLRVITTGIQLGL